MVLQGGSRGMGHVHRGLRQGYLVVAPPPPSKQPNRVKNTEIGSKTCFPLVFDHCEWSEYQKKLKISIFDL